MIIHKLNENKKNLFDRELLAANQARYYKKFEQNNFLFHETANLILENLTAFPQKFENALEISCRDGYLSQNLKAKKITKTNLIKDFPDVIKDFPDVIKDFPDDCLIIDDEKLDFADESFDLIVSNLNLHFINDVPSFLVKIRNFLRPNGVFIASFFGEDNLIELKDILFKVENTLFGGVSPRIAPTIDVKTAAMLLQKAGFKNPISDLERFNVNYASAFDLMRDLKLMGQGNILFDRSKKFVTKRFLQEVNDLYQKTYPDLEFQGIAAKFEVVTILGIK